VSSIGFYHTVERGQTLFRIAKMYQIDLKELSRANRLTGTRLEVGQKLFIPGTPTWAPGPAAVAPSAGEIQSLVGPRSHAVWKTITVHHSGTKNGSAAAFHRDHLRRRMGGLFYHFVIGNGSQTPDGAIEVGWRWKRQVKANRPYDIQICVVGNFNHSQVSESQFLSLVRLIRILRQEYGIPTSHVRKHQDIKGKHTACPGDKFPFYRLISELQNPS